jgi:hypothetical protein
LRVRVAVITVIIGLGNRCVVGASVTVTVSVSVAIAVCVSVSVELAGGDVQRRDAGAGDRGDRGRRDR